MQADILEDIFSEDGLIIDYTPTKISRMYSVVDNATGIVLATNVTLAEARSIAAVQDMMFGASGASYSYNESRTKLASGRILFSDENPEEQSHDWSHVSSHVELHVHGAQVYDNLSADDAHDLIELWLNEDWVNDEYESNLSSLRDALPIINDMLVAYPPLIDSVIENILRPFPTKHSIIGAPYVIRYGDAANDAPAPTSVKPAVDKFGQRRVAKLPSSASRERRYRGVPESVLMAHGYTLLDAATLRPIMSGTRETIREYFADNPSQSMRTVRIVKYANVWRYVGRVYRDGFTAFVRGRRVVSGTRSEVAAFLNAEHKRIGITAKDARIIPIASNPLPVVAYTMR